MLWVAIIGILYVISRINYLLFHALAELFSVFVAYVVFLIWKSKVRLENRSLIFIGVAYFFVASLDLLHTFAYKGMGIFPQFSSNLPTQLWIAARYMESISLLIALSLLTNTHAENAKEYVKSKEYFEPVEKEGFFWRAFFLYAGVTTACVLSIFVFRNFPDSYIEGLDLLLLRSQANI